MKVFISQPMGGLSDTQIKDERNKMISIAEDACEDDVEIIDSFFQGAPREKAPLWFLGKSLELLSTADAAVFAPGWELKRGCRIEHKCCEEYGIKILGD